MTIKKDDLIITLIGKVNSGKSLLFCKLLNLGEGGRRVSPVAGWTKEIELERIYKDTFLADTPGLEDIETEVSKRAFDFKGATDIFAHVINAAEGITATVKSCSEELFKTGRPVVTIINKIDALSGEGEFAEMKADIFEKLPHIRHCGRIYFTCASSGEGLPGLRDGLLEILRGGEKMLKLARFLRDNRPEIEAALYNESLSFVKYATARALAISVSPVPFSETVPLMMNQYYMIMRIAGVYGDDITFKNIRAVAGSFGAAVVGTSLASTFFAGVKSAVAGSVTYALGRVMIAWIASGKNIPLDRLKKMFDEFKSGYKKENVDIDTEKDIKYIEYAGGAESFAREKEGGGS